MSLNIRSVRFRTAAGAAVALVALLAIAGVVIFALVAGAIRDAFDQALLEQALDRAALLETGAEPGSLTTTVGDEEAIAVIGADGTVLASSGAANPEALVAVPLGLSDADIAITTTDLHDAEEDPHLERLRLATVAAATGERVVVGNEAERVGSTIGSVAFLLTLVTSLVALASAIVAWFVTGRALAPVGQMRRDLDGIVHAGSGRRVGQPGSGDEIDELAGTMNEVLDRLDAHSSARQQFVSDASHELKSPLANARIQLETAPSVLDGAAQIQLRNDVIGELDRVQALVDDLLYLAKADEATPSRPDHLSLDDVVFDEAERASLRTDKTVDGSGVQPVIVAADRNETARAIRNLIENAVRHASERIDVAIEVQPRHAIVAISDDGPGIAEADRARAFERFVRLSSGRARSDGGTGLGLSIVAAVAERNGGSVQVASSPSGGARFELRLPRP